MSDASGGDLEGESEDSPPRNEEPSIEELRERVEEQYDFEDFTPADMAEMSAEEWQAAFDPESWITGPRLLDRVEADLKRRVADRQLFAVVERVEVEGEERIAAYSGSDYAIVAPDGSVAGEGMVLREVKPIVALCSMESYDAGPMPEGTGPMLPDPREVSASAGSLGDRLVLAVALAQLLAGVALIAAPVVLDLQEGVSGFLTFVVGLGFVFIAVVIGILVANARLSGRFRAEEYRERLRAAGVGTEDRPDFLPFEEGGESPLVGGDDAEDGSDSNDR